MHRHAVLLTNCLAGPGPDLARRLADAGATVLLNSREDVQELGDLLQEIAGAGGRAVACNLDPGDHERFEAVVDFVESMAGPITGVVLQPELIIRPRPLEDTPTENIRDAVGSIVEDAVDWCRLALPALSGGQDAALVGLWSSNSSGSISAAAAYAAWEQVLACTRNEAVPKGVGVHVVSTPSASFGAAERNNHSTATQSVVDTVISLLGVAGAKPAANRVVETAEGVAK